MEKWVKTLKKAREADSLLNNRYQKGEVHNVYNESFEGNKRWTFRDEIYGGESAIIVDNEFWHIDEDGAQKARTTLGEPQKCLVTKITIAKPSLRKETAARITDLIPSTFLVDGVRWYVLGYGAFRFNRPNSEMRYTCYLACKSTTPLNIGDTHPRLKFFPGLKKRVLFGESFFALKVTETPEWIYGQPERARQYDKSLQEVDKKLSGPQEGSPGAWSDVNYFENAVRPSGKR